MENDRKPRPGEIYDHFKGKPYQIITVATHTETGESMVVYQAMYGDFKTYVRPLSMFLSEVDRSKYPEAKQKYRFELRKDKMNTGATEQEEHACKQSEQTDTFAEASEHIDKKLDKQALDDRNDIDEVIKENATKENSVKENSMIEKSIIKNPMIEKSIIKNPMIDLKEDACEEGINEILLKFLDASSYTKKLEIITSNTKHLTDRLINDMAVSLDCTVEEGPLEQRIKGLEYCLQAMRRFEDRRLR